MTACDALLDALVRGVPLDARARDHLRVCAECGRDRAAAARLGHTLAAAAGAPPAGLAARVRVAAAPLLTVNARRGARATLMRAVVAAVLPLPLVLLLDLYVVRTAYALLSAVLPTAISIYVVANYAALLALLVTLAYGAIPLVSDWQMRMRREESYG